MHSFVSYRSRATGKIGESQLERRTEKQLLEEGQTFLVVREWKK
jgi:hypothetical protein